MGATASVLGASGFSGAELVRLLHAHPAIEIETLGAGSRSGEPAARALPHLAGALEATLAPIADAAAAEVDVCFSCLPGGSLPEVLGSVRAGMVIDLADDFRADLSWAYGITELNRAALADATRVANPGCYPTATLLCLVPFARAGLVGPGVVVDALSGSSGAGRAPAAHLSLAELGGNATAYGTTMHRHVAEIERGLADLGGLDTTVSFTPHLVPMARGVLVTARAPLTAELDDAEALDVLAAAYAGEPFVHVDAEWPSTKPVTGSNAAHVSARVDLRSGLLIASAAIDNLGKGAAGQAVQNANLLLGLDETTGLSAVGLWP